MARIKDIDERKRGNNTNGLFFSRFEKQSNLRAGWLFLYFFGETKNQLPEAEWIFRLFPKAWRPKINAAGSMLNVLSSINEGFPRGLRSKYPNESTTTSSPRAKILLLPILRASIESKNWICQSSPSPPFVPQSFLPLSSSKSIERIGVFGGDDIRKIGGSGNSMVSTTAIEKRERLVSIRLGTIFDIKGCGDMQPESGCIIWPMAKGDQLLPVRCTFDLSVRDHFAWLTTTLTHFPRIFNDDSLLAILPTSWTTLFLSNFSSNREFVISLISILFRELFKRENFQFTSNLSLKRLL